MKLIYIVFFAAIIITNSIMPNFGFSQCEFSYKYSTLFNEEAYAGIETSNGEFIIAAATETNSPGIYNTLLIKLNCQGDTTAFKSISKNVESCSITDIIKSENDTFFGFGIVQTSTETLLWVLKFNSNLDIFLDTTYSLSQTVIIRPCAFYNYNTDLVIYGSVGLDYDHLDPFIYILSPSGDSISYMCFPASGFQYVYSMIEKPNYSGYYMMIWGQYQITTPTWGQILTIDHNLCVSGIDSLPKDLDMYYNAKVFNDHEFLITGKVHRWNSNPRTDQLGIKRLDTLFTMQYSNTFGPEDTITYPAYIYNLDFIDTNNIFYGGTCNQALISFSTEPSFFILGKFDSQLNLKWQKYYGGDQYYSLWGITATSDGGCLLYGSTFNYLTQNMERDVFIVKTDSEGVITGSNEKSDRCFHDLIIYPNPGKDYFIIESGPQVKGDRFILRDLSGIQLIDLQINTPTVRVETKSLSDGTYIWQLISQNRVIDSGKWIKLTK